MTNPLPPEAQAQLQLILQKLLLLLEGANTLTTARSEYMNYDGAMGGQVLESDPDVEHPYDELAKDYTELFARAQKAGLELREVETIFERSTPNDAWGYKTRWLAAPEYRAFIKKLEPVVSEIGLALKKIGPETAKDWYVVSFNNYPESPRLLVLHGDRVRVVKQPTEELLGFAEQIKGAAQQEGLELTGASWRVELDENDGEVDSSVGVQRAWPQLADLQR